MEYVLFGAFGVAILVVVVLWQRSEDKAEAKRRAALESAVVKCGWKFAVSSEITTTFHQLRGDKISTAPPATAKWFADALLNPESGLTSDLIVRPDGSCALFEYKVWQGSGRFRFQHVQTVVYVHSDRVLPQVSIEPRSSSAETEFTDAYAIRTADPATFDRFLSDGLREYLLKNPGMAIDATGRNVYVRRRSLVASPEQITAFADWGESVVRMFAPRLG